jgi:hypothetical protein
MLSPRVEWLLNYCSCTGCDTSIQQELQIQLSTDLTNHSKGRITDQISKADSFDITFTPRSLRHDAISRSTPITPRQKGIRDQLELPQLHTYPCPPNSSPDEPEEERRQKLLEMYQEFGLDMHTGMYLTQLTSNRDYSDIHCQLMEDMQTLKLDQSNGRIIEFPLTGVSKVYRIINNDDKWYSAGSPLPGLQSSSTEHIVVVEFMRRKLAFVFKELQMSQRFLMCMELLIRRAQQKQAKKALRSITPAFGNSNQNAGMAQVQSASPIRPKV